MSGRPGPQQARRPLVVEVVGVAGAGKSTLARSLTAAGGLGPLADTLRTSDPRHLGAVLRGLPAGLVVLARSIARRRPLTWVELKLVLYLAGFDPRSDLDATAEWLVLDQGPVYSFARLLARDGARTSPTVPARSWGAWLARWAARLDLVVLLDAPTETLLARIDGRDQAHEVKGVDRGRASTFVERYRWADEQVVSALERRGVRVVRIDTGKADPDEVLDLTMGAAATTVRRAVGR